MRVLWVIALLQCLHIQQSLQESELLKVSIYYESLCPDSIRFINNQLYPAYQKIGSSLKIDFVPYGKASHEEIDGKWKFECQHGENECWGNKAQACGLALEKGQDADVEFVNCVMSQRYPANEDAINTCAPKLNSTGQPIIDCSRSPAGDKLLVKYGDQTHAVNPLITFVPTIIFNDKYDADIQDGSLRDFLRTACRALSKKPSGCPKDSDTVVMDFS